MPGLWVIFRIPGGVCMECERMTKKTEENNNTNTTEAAEEKVLPVPEENSAETIRKDAYRPGLEGVVATRSSICHASQGWKE